MIRLDQYKDKQHFSVPEGYFDQFQNEVMQVIRSEIEKDKRKRIRRNYWFSITGVAASVAIIIGILSFFPSANQSLQLAQNDISPTMVVESQESRIQPIDEANELISPVPKEQHLTSSLLEQKTEEKTLVAVEEKPIVQLEEKSQPLKETIVYVVMEYYNDDNLYDLFSETLYDLECCYDY